MFNSSQDHDPNDGTNDADSFSILELLGAGVKTWQADVLGLLLVVVGVGSALLLHEATRRNALRFLFERPAWARLVSRRSGNAVAPADA